MPKTITVKELISELEAMDPNMEVHLAYNYGDHWRTQVAPSVTAVEEVTVAWSDYHNMDKVIDEDEAREEHKTNARQAVILRQLGHKAGWFL